MKKKFLNTIILIALIMSTLSITSYAVSEPSAWASQEVLSAKNAGIITSNVTQDYQGNITREQFCELVMTLYEKLTDIKEIKIYDIFDDTDNEEILKAYQLGIVKGVADNLFSPNAFITRQEICVMLTRCIDVAIERADIQDYNVTQFSDMDKISDWALSSVQYAFDNNIIKGVGENKIEPLGNTTCEQAILLAYRIYENNAKDSILNIGNTSDSQEKIIFEDEAFEYSVRYSLGDYNEIYNGNLTDDILKELDTLTLLPKDGTILVKSIKDMKYLPNLKRLFVINNHEIADFSPIAQIKTWDEIDLQGSIIENDAFLDEIIVSRYIAFPNLPEPWTSAPNFDDEYTYKDALRMYRQTLDELDFIENNILSYEMTDYEKYKILHDYLVKKMRYDMIKYHSDFQDYDGYIPSPHDLSTVLLTGKGVCQDYASGYANLCTYFGLECFVVTGDADNGVDGWGAHAWNIVNIDGNYYHVDTTWDDPDKDEHTDIIGYSYFLLSDDEISSDHDWPDDDVCIGTMNEIELAPLPKCIQNYEGGAIHEGDDYDDGIRFIDGIQYNITEIIYAATEELIIPERESISCTISVPEFNAELQEYIVWVRFYENDEEMASASWCIESKQFYTRYSNFENY